MAKLSTLRKKYGDYCHYCGYQLEFEASGTNKPTSPTRDHIITKLISKSVNLGKTNSGITNLRLAHSYCNSARGQGVDCRHEPGFQAFIKSLEKRGFKKDPSYCGPVNHQYPIPQTSGKIGDSKKFWFCIGPIQFDIAWVKGRYWHFRICMKNFVITDLAGKNGY